MSRNIDELRSYIHRLLTEGEETTCPTEVENALGEAHVSLDRYPSGESRVAIQIDWWRNPLDTTEFATGLADECNLDNRERLFLTIHHALHFPFNAIERGVSEYGVKAQWEVVFDYPKAFEPLVEEEDNE